MGGCQNYGFLLGPLNTRCRVILRTQKGTTILTTTHHLHKDLFLRPDIHPQPQIGTKSGLINVYLELWVFLWLGGVWLGVAPGSTICDEFTHTMAHQC